MSTSSSSKRGRKRNDNLPPNRARDVQRAFRARRAAHLQELEQRVAELEEENENLRSALSLPPSDRVSLGHGPTGRDKARTDRLDSCTEGSVSPQTSSSSHNSSSVVMKGFSESPYGDLRGSDRSWEHIVGSASKEEYMDGTENDFESAVASSIASSYDQDYNFAPCRVSSSAPSSSRSSTHGTFYLSPNPNSFIQSPDRPTTSSPTFSRDDSFCYPNHNMGNHFPTDPLHSTPQPAPVNYPLAAPYHPTQRSGSILLGGDSSLPHNRPHSFQLPQFQREQYPPQGQTMPQNGGYGMRKSASESISYSTSLETYPSPAYAQQHLPSQAQSNSVSIRLPSPIRPQAAPINYIQKSPSCPDYTGPEGTSQSSFHRPI